MFVSHKFSQVEGQHWYKLFVCLFSSRNWPKKCNAGKFLTLKIVFSETRNILIDMSLYITYSHQRVYEQARKPRSYASLKLWLTYLLTGVRFRATSVAKNCPPLLPTQCVEWPFRCSDSPFFWSHKNGYTFLKIQRFNSAEDLMMSRQCCRFNWGLPPPYATLQLFSSKYLWTLQYDRLELLKSKRL